MKPEILPTSAFMSTYTARPGIPQIIGGGKPRALQRDFGLLEERK